MIRVRQGIEDLSIDRRDAGYFPILTYQLSAAALAKNQPALREAVSKAVKDMRVDGISNRLSNRWLGVSYQMSVEIAKAERP